MSKQRDPLPVLAISGLRFIRTWERVYSKGLDRLGYDMRSAIAVRGSSPPLPSRRSTRHPKIVALGVPSGSRPTTAWSATSQSRWRGRWRETYKSVDLFTGFSRRQVGGRRAAWWPRWSFT